nr:uncharacterized protein LOC113687483 [Coffea arabica]
MHPNKAPGTDGMSPLFFQHYWDIIKIDVVAAIKSFFHTGHLLKAVNDTIISLIPKVDSPESVVHFRPISLCNVLYKIISKIIANRLKGVLHHCISPSQSAFIPGRQILDNVVVAHEILHFLKNRRKGRVAFMALKLDMSKAYDRVEWKFVGRVMMKMGFCPIFVRWIMSCLSTVTYSFNLNGQKVGCVQPSRGLRQGDPLSPYLFIICAEGLSCLIDKAMMNKEITGIKICKDSPMVSHLFFADDSLLCCQATKQEARKVKSILERYGQASGQVVNFEKSAIFYSKNTTDQRKNGVREELDNIKEARNGTYLGLPMAIGRSKTQVFAFVQNKISNKLQDWKQKLLSQGGKEILVKSVIMAMPTYVMACFRLPRGLCRQITGKIARFWWRKGEKGSCVHWASWKKLSEVKGRGGLGFRDLEAFNTALLAKQIWRFLMAPNLLVSKVMKAKYMRDEKWMDKNPVSSASWCWKSIHSAASFLYDGLWKRIGDGSVKSGYAVARQQEGKAGRRTGQEAETSWEIRKRNVWKQLWHLKVKAKLKHFMWKCLQNCLPVNEQLSKRLHRGEGRCGCCGEDMETIEHLFFFCDKAVEAWKLAPVRWDGLMGMQYNFWLWWEQVTQSLALNQGQERVSLTINILWQIWKARNKNFFEKVNQDPVRIVRKAQDEWLEFEQVRNTDQMESTGKMNDALPTRRVRTRKEEIRLYTDATISAKRVRTGQGIIARNWKGQLLKAKGIVTQGKGSASEVEARAVRNALLMATQAGWTKIIVHTDCKSVVEHITKRKEFDYTTAAILEDVQELSLAFEKCSFVFIPRTENQISHQLAQYAVMLVHDIEWENDFPIWLTELARTEMRVVSPFCN